MLFFFLNLCDAIVDKPRNITLCADNFSIAFDSQGDLTTAVLPRGRLYSQSLFPNTTQLKTGCGFTDFAYTSDKERVLIDSVNFTARACVDSFVLPSLTAGTFCNLSSRVTIKIECEETTTHFRAAEFTPGACFFARETAFCGEEDALRISALSSENVTVTYFRFSDGLAVSDTLVASSQRYDKYDRYAAGILIEEARVQADGSFEAIVLGNRLETAATECAFANSTSGQVVGLYNSPGVITWRGIRYAEYPQRLTQAQLARYKNETQRAFHNPPRCPQVDEDQLTGEEDCLFLNVFRRADAPYPLPVMVWIYGGGFNWGGIDQYDFRQFAADQGVVVVAMNYRLGALGFLYSDGTANKTGAGNLGTLDQQVALRWVNENIGKFGGNPLGVTLMGQSAGALTVLWHMTNIQSRGYFDKGIAQSAVLLQSVPYLTLAHAQEYGNWWVEQYLNCSSSDFTCISEAPVSAFILTENVTLKSYPAGASPTFPLYTFSPVIDNEHLDGHPVDLMKTEPSRFENVTLIIGANENDGSVFVLALDQIDPNINGTYMTNEMYIEFLGLVHPGLSTAQLPSRYKPQDKDGDIKYSVASEKLVTDMSFKCPARNISRSLPHSYLYQYNLNLIDSQTLQRAADSVFPGAETIMDILAVFHGSEVPVIFSWNYLQTNDVALREASKYVFDSYDTAKKNMGCLWGSFARDGYPNCKDSPQWPQYAATQQTMLIKDNQKLQLDLDTGPSDSDCDFLVNIQPLWRVPTNYSLLSF